MLKKMDFFCGASLLCGFGVAFGMDKEAGSSALVPVRDAIVSGGLNLCLQEVQ